MEILFSHKFLRCDLSILPQKRASRNFKHYLPLEERGLIGFKCSSECLVREEGAVKKVGTFVVVLKGTVSWPPF